MTTEPLPPIAVRAQAPTTPTVPDPGLGLTWGPLSPADAPELAALVAVIEAADAQPTRTSPPEVAEWFDGDWKDHARDTLAGRDAAGAMRAWAQVRTAPGDTNVVRAFLGGGVHPDWRGRGVGRALVAWMDGRARQLLAASGKELPARLAAFLRQDDTAGLRLYTAAGFAPVRYYAEMRRPLDGGVPDVGVPDGIRIVAWSDELDEQVRLAHNEAFADHWGSEPRTPESWAIERSMFAPQWSRVAVDELTGEVAGYAVSGRYEHDWPVAGYSSGYTELLGVRRRWRGRGLAVSILAEVMRAYRADGMEYAELTVDTANPSGAHGLYASLGYEVSHGEVLYSIEI
ncbi:N-acetyltransferase family protein [Cellulomonas hominis]